MNGPAGHDGYLALCEEQVGYVANTLPGLVLPNVQTCAGLLLRFHHGNDTQSYAAAHLSGEHGTDSGAYGRWATRVKLAGKCIRETIINQLHGCELHDVILYYSPFWKDFLHSHTGQQVLAYLESSSALGRSPHLLEQPDNNAMDIRLETPTGAHGHSWVAIRRAGQSNPLPTQFGMDQSLPFVFWELNPTKSPGWYKRDHFPPQYVRHEAMHDGVSWVDLDVPN